MGHPHKNGGSTPTTTSGVVLTQARYAPLLCYKQIVLLIFSSTLSFHLKCIVGVAGLTEAGTDLIINDCYSNDDRFVFHYKSDKSYQHKKQSPTDPDLCVSSSSTETTDLGYPVIEYAICSASSQQLWIPRRRSDETMRALQGCTDDSSDGKHCAVYWIVSLVFGHFADSWSILQCLFMIQNPLDGMTALGLTANGMQRAITVKSLEPLTPTLERQQIRHVVYVVVSKQWIARIGKQATISKTAFSLVSPQVVPTSWGPSHHHLKEL